MEQVENKFLIIKVIDGRLRVCLPNGEPLQGEILVRVKDELDCLPEAIIKCIVKIETNG